MNSNELALGSAGDRFCYRGDNKVTRFHGLRRRRCSPAFVIPAHLFTVTKCPAFFTGSKLVRAKSPETTAVIPLAGRDVRFNGATHQRGNP